MLQERYFLRSHPIQCQQWISSIINSYTITWPMQQFYIKIYIQRIRWNVESRNSFTDERSESIQPLNNVTHLYLKTVSKSIRSAQDPVRIRSYEEYKLNVLHLWETTWVSHGQSAQGEHFMDSITLEYTAKV